MHVRGVRGFDFALMLVWVDLGDCSWRCEGFFVAEKDTVQVSPDQSVSIEFQRDQGSKCQNESQDLDSSLLPRFVFSD